MKKWLVLFIFMSVVLVACSEEKVTPNDRFEAFVSNWNELEIGKLYDYFSADTKEAFPAEQSVERQQKIYDDLQVSEIAVSYEALEEESLKTAMEEGTATLPFTVEMETFAGPISFDYEATLVREGEEEAEDWFVQWNQGFVFPELKDGGEINFHTTTPIRGEILDRNQMPLALNDVVYEVGIVPEKLGNNPEENKEKIAKALNISVDSIDNALSAGWVQPNLFVPIKKIYDEELLTQLWQIDGISSQEVSGRVYPAGKAAAHLVGYIGQITAEELEKQEPGVYSANDVIGKRGLEQLYEQRLKGEPGIQVTISKENEEDVVIVEKPVKNGENISVTIDINIQEKIYANYGEDSGSSAAINPKTGETLALVSSPSFDPNEILYGTTSNIWATLQDDPKNPLLNRFSATYAPGSVIKPVTASIGLQNGIIVPDEGIEINGLTWSNGSGWGDYEVRRVSTSNGPVDLRDSLVRSDNIYYAMKAVEMGTDAFVTGMEQFGFGEALPYEYPITASSVSSTGTMEDEVQLANSSYGQGQLEVSPLHIASTYTTFLNGGNMIKPTLLMTEKTGEIWQEGLITEDQATDIQEAMRAVVTEPNGTAHKANDADFPIAGKTGTAELKLTSEQGGAENSWFVAYPSDSQDILIAMMIEETQEKGSSYIVEKMADLLMEIK
ncbi:penicillin-binding transpeptidase domain-containing protein [Oceanobacillus chungangensis]|uniref:serine-type D-Ala-D-Ala carboxypeptidase n=1 Tax=Oceanobacillus chungangensis TaxID=1229152 RepID=A0A3D8PJ17_9BACI|nr:penicillin-binding transpeptidase domain-containing protein [Oceanobacillus chungangensis]RDW15652.1 penicillin-binding protein [Oceanobacillus chungangensis]